MQIKTHRFGDLEVSQEQVLRFREGLIGFPSKKRFVLLPVGRSSPLWWLQAADDPYLAFVVMDPTTVIPDYRPSIPPRDLAAVGLASVDEAQLLVLVVIPSDPAEMTVNLQGPIVLNPRTRAARQVVLGEGPFSTRHPIIREVQRTARRELASGQAGRVSAQAR